MNSILIIPTQIHHPVVRDYGDEVGKQTDPSKRNYEGGGVPENISNETEIEGWQCILTCYQL
jgi:hypothetical protein